MQMIPVCEPIVGEKELEYVNEALKTGWISSEGGFLKGFEESFSRYVQRKHGVAVNNGTNALILAVRALDLTEGSEIILPSFTIMSCAMACIYNGIVPIFVDSEPDTWNMDITQIEQKISPNTRAIMAVHIYGHPVDMDALQDIARRYSLLIIEDFAEAIGSEYKGTKCGKFGDISCVSFYANKVITTGEGGMCLTDDDTLADRLKKLRNLAFEPQKRFLHNELGFNFRLTNVQAAIGLAQLERIDELVSAKIRNGEKYNELLANLKEKGLVRLPVERIGSVNTYWMYGVVLSHKAGYTAEQVMEMLIDNGIQTRPFFYPLHKQPAFKKFPWYVDATLPVSENISEYGLYLPSGVNLTIDDLSMISERLSSILVKSV